MIPSVLHLGTFKYVLAALHAGKADLSLLESNRDNYKRRLEEAEAVVSKDPESDLALKNLAYYSRAYRAYCLLISQLRDKPDLLPKVLVIVGHAKRLKDLISRLEALGFEINTHLWGEGMYQSPSYKEKLVPPSELLPSDRT